MTEGQEAFADISTATWHVVAVDRAVCVCARACVVYLILLRIIILYFYGMSFGWHEIE
jgi:hypothetical protein